MKVLHRLGLGRLGATAFVALARRPWAAETLARVTAWALARRVRWVGPSRPKDGLQTLFALSAQRIWPDALMLSEERHFAVLTLPDNDQFFVQGAFFRNRADPTAYRVDPRIGAIAAEFRSFLARVWPHFMRRIGAAGVIGAHFKYKQDLHWGPAAHAAGIPYFVIYRESLKLSVSEQAVLTGVCHRLGKFEGTKILTWNDVVGDVLVNAGFVPRDKVVTTGNVRVGKFVAACRANRRPPGAKPTATLFSMRAGDSLNGLNAGSWPANPYLGWVRLFERTHSAFAQAAIDSPHARFVIKTKWEHGVHDLIRHSLACRGLDADKIKNLEITAKVDPNDLILQSSVVVAFASTTLLEAGLGGGPVIVPEFEEALDPYYREHLKLLDYYPYCTIARSADELTRLVNEGVRSNLKVNAEIQRQRERFFARLVCPLEGDPLQRCADEIRAGLNPSGSLPRRQAA